MPLDPDKLLALDIPDVEHTYGPKDCILYALSLGLGQDPMDENELAFDSVVRPPRIKHGERLKPGQPTSSGSAASRTATPTACSTAAGRASA